MRTDMLMTIVCESVADALRHPEKYPQDTREGLAMVMDDLIKAGKISVLSNLMNEQLNKGE